MEDAGLSHRQTITWYETFGVNCTMKFNRCSRPLLWMVRNPRRFMFDPSAVRTSSARLGKYRDKRANLAGKILDDVWTIPRLAGTHRGDRSSRQLPTRPEHYSPHQDLYARILLGASRSPILFDDPIGDWLTAGRV
jgi:hypothetical protein